MRLLIVEDEAEIATMLASYLRKEGFVVDRAGSLDMAHEAIATNDFDLVVLDRMLPDGDGLSLVEKAGEGRRFLILTALDDLDDRIGGLEAGAIDYLVKPFEPRELLARVRNALRYPVTEKQTLTTFGPLEYNVQSASFTVDDEPLILRRTEGLILAELMARPGALVTRETLDTRVYGYDQMVNANSLETQISRLRQTLAQNVPGITIMAMRGVGYRLVKG